MSHRKEKQPKPTPPPTPPPGEPYVILAGVVLAALLVRMWRLTADLPVVGDESIYLRWAEIIDNQGNWFISLLDGKPPLSYWLYAVTRWIWPDDPLFGPRMISALAGAGATLGVWAVTRRLTTPRAALIATGLYALLPWAMVYDRLAYTEALVNLAGVWMVWASLRAFAGERPATWGRALAAGFLLGLGFFTKTTILLLAPAPLLAAGLHGLAGVRRNLAPLGATYALAAAFLALNAMLTPEAPRGETSSAVFHKTHFFVPASELLAAPFAAFAENAPALGQFLASYLTVPGLLAAIVAAAWLVSRRSRAAWLLLALSAAPILAQAFLIDRTFSRYPYPHLWPLLVLVALAAGDALARPRLRLWAMGGLGLTFAAFLTASFAAVRYPSDGLAPIDAGYYFGDGPNAGWGVEQAVRHVRAAGGRTLVLTDPVWGTPADALFAYLNGRHGVRVAEAWWIDADPGNPIYPGPEAVVWKSHYERTAGEPLDLRTYDSVFYVTITNYHPRAEIAARQPNARLELSVPKPGGAQSLDVYRLR